MHEKFLKIPLYKMYYLDNFDEFQGITIEQWDLMGRDYSSEEIEGIIGSIEWARMNPNYDFKSLLPDLKYENTQIYKFFCIILKSYRVYCNSK